MFGPCSRLDCKQQTLCFVVYVKRGPKHGRVMDPVTGNQRHKGAR